MSLSFLHAAALDEYGRVFGTDRASLPSCFRLHTTQEKVKQGQKKAASEQKEADDWKAGAKVRFPPAPLPSGRLLLSRSGCPEELTEGLTYTPFRDLQVKDTSKEDKRQAELARKAELARLLAEVASLPSIQGEGRRRRT